MPYCSVRRVECLVKWVRFASIVTNVYLVCLHSVVCFSHPTTTAITRYAPQKRGKTTKDEETVQYSQFMSPGHSNWTNCSILSQCFSEKFPTFSPSYWGANSYYPRGLIMGVGRISHLPIWMTQRGLSAWGIQTGPFAAL